MLQLAPFAPAIAHWEILEKPPAALAEPSAWTFDAALLLVDVSGFTNLCTRLDIDALQRHINSYFGLMMDVVQSHGGDVLRFAGDAIYCAWSLRRGSASDGTLALATRAACACALELSERCGTYEIPEAGSRLSIHSGVGAGELSGFRVGNTSRWEFLVAGDPLRQVAEAESCAALGEAVVAAEAWRLAEHFCEGSKRGDGGRMRLLTAMRADDDDEKRRARDAERLRARSIAPDLVTMQRSGLSHLAFSRGNHESALEAYVHETARRAIQNNVDLDGTKVSERRFVVAAFAKVGGLEPALAAGVDGLGAVQSCLAAALEVISGRGGLLRQFLVDDKGVVIIWTFGLPQASFEDNCTRGLTTAFDVDAALARQGLEAHIGITAGSAYCGLVGVPQRRCEYGVMGPSVNLAARLMCACEKKGVRLLCCDTMCAELQKQGKRSQFIFDAFAPVAVKGYSQPVMLYHPKPNEWLNEVQRKLQNIKIFNLLSEREQASFGDLRRPSEAFLDIMLTLKNSFFKS